MKLKLTALSVGLMTALALAGNASADDENTLVVNDGQQRVWYYVKTDSSSAFTKKEDLSTLETINLDRSDKLIEIEPVEILKVPSIVKTEGRPVYKYELAPNSRVFIGMPDRTEQEAQEIEYKKYNHYRSATVPAGRHVEPLYTVAGAGVKTRF